MSERASTSLPSTCSGDMYWNVPTTDPCAVRGWLPGGVAKVAERPDAADALASDALARPKSISLAPVLVSMMLPGFKSRCTTPLRCAFSSPSQISVPYFKTCSMGIRALVQTVCQGLTFQVFHDQVVDAVLVANVVQCANVGMVQG